MWSTVSTSQACGNRNDPDEMEKWGPPSAVLWNGLPFLWDDFFCLGVHAINSKWLIAVVQSQSQTCYNWIEDVPEKTSGSLPLISIGPTDLRNLLGCTGCVHVASIWGVMIPEWESQSLFLCDFQSDWESVFSKAGKLTELTVPWKELCPTVSRSHV